MQLALYVAGVSALLAGVMVSLGRKEIVSRVSFVLFALAMGVWSIGIGLFLAASTESQALVYAKLYYVSALLLIYGFVMFSLHWREEGKGAARIGRTPALLYFMPVAALLPLVITPGLFLHGAEVSDHGPSVSLVGLSYGLYVLLFVVYSFIAFYYLSDLLRTAKKISKRVRKQTTLLLAVMAVCLPAGAWFNLFLPLLGNYRLIDIGPLFILPIVAAVFYGIVKHSLFDVRLATARLATYILTLSVIGCAYGVFAFLALSLFLGVDVSLVTKIALTGGTLFASLLFASVLKLFNRVSDRIFFQKTYSLEEFIGQLNGVFVSTNDITDMLQKSATIIEKFTKAEHVVFGVRPINDLGQRMVGVGKIPRYSQHDINEVRSITPSLEDKVLLADKLPTKFARLSVILKKNNVEVLCRLAGNVGRKEEGAGYLVLGPKKSGAPYSAYDVHVLRVVVNTLVIAIENTLHFEQIQHFNETLQQKVDEATKKLRRNNEKLKALDSTKDEFISMASHQLRTPLTSVKGYLSMVLDGDAGALTEDQRKLLNQAYVSSQRMVYTIADLLNVSRLQTGKFEIERSPVNLANIVAEEIAPLQESARLKSIMLEYVPPAFCPPLMLDEMKTRQVIMNFIDNAIYYTSSGGRIDIKIQATGKMLEFLVIDSGMGVPKKDQPHLFTKFYRASNAQKARPDGTGLGLFMAKKIIIAEGGSLIFKSTEGKGSTFGFSFPLVKE